MKSRHGNTTPHCNLCGALIRWAQTSNGGNLPLDAEPDPMGNLVLDEYNRVGPMTGEPGTPDMRTRYTRHDCKER